MGAIILLDTSIYLNVLDVPGWNQSRVQVLEEFEKKIKCGDQFILPLSTVLETGNHISDLPDGGRRWEFSVKLVNEVKKAFAGEAPYYATYFPEREEFLRWLDCFPEFAKIEKGKKPTEGISFSDLSIINVL